MSEQGTEFTNLEVEEDVEAHIGPVYSAPEDEDDVEGHVQPPRGDDTDHVHSIFLQ